MTAAPAAATTAAPITPPPARAASQPSADPFAFAAVLDTLPGAPAKAGASTAEEQAHRSKEPSKDPSSGGQTARHPLPNDSALMASLPFALRAAAMMNGLPQAEQSSSSPASPPVRTSKSEGGGASVAASGKTASVGRLVGERAFHFGATASRTLAVNAPTAPAVAADLNVDNASIAGSSLALATPATPAADAVPPVANAMAPAMIGPPARPPSSANRASPARAAAHPVARSAPKPVGSAPSPAAHPLGSTSPPAPAGSSVKTVDGRLPDPTPSSAPSPTQTSPFGGELSASFATGSSFEPDASTTNAASADVAPHAAPLVGSVSSNHPVKEIDVDLSPGGLEDVSMTMRLAGDRLSVVIRAASSQTLGSIEGARDAIADRLAAIGQPLDSLIVKQTGVNTNGNTNANAASADDGSAGETPRPAQGAGEWGGSNDALSRRGAGRDRNF